MSATSDQARERAGAGRLDRRGAVAQLGRHVLQAEPGVELLLARGAGAAGCAAGTAARARAGQLVERVDVPRRRHGVHGDPRAIRGRQRGAVAARHDDRGDVRRRREGGQHVAGSGGRDEQLDPVEHLVPAAQRADRGRLAAAALLAQPREHAIAERRGLVELQPARRARLTGIGGLSNMY